MRTDRCSSTCAGEVSTVVAIGGSSAAQREYTGAASSSTSDSVRPQMRSTRRDRRPRPAIGARRSATTRSSIGFSSAGGPGSRSSTCPSCSSHSPGAVPKPFGRTSAPSGTMACRRLISGMRAPRAANRRRIASTRSGCSRSARPVTADTASRVRSSSVGPSPPHSTTRSVRASAARRTASRSAGRSPTIALALTSMPYSFSRSVMKSELVSSRGGTSSSLPTAMISAQCTAGRRRASLMPAAPGAPTAGAARVRFA